MIHDATRNFMEDKWREMHGCSMHWIKLLVGINEINRISKIKQFLYSNEYSRGLFNVRHIEMYVNVKGI